MSFVKNVRKLEREMRSMSGLADNIYTGYLSGSIRLPEFRIRHLVGYRSNVQVHAYHNSDYTHRMILNASMVIP